MFTSQVLAWVQRHSPKDIYNYEGKQEKDRQVPFASPCLDSRKHGPWAPPKTRILVRCFKFGHLQMTITQFCNFKLFSLPVDSVRSGGTCLRSSTV